MGNRSMTTLEQLSASDAQVILDRLPERIRMALLERAMEIDHPIERVVEMAIASFWIRRRWDLRIVVRGGDSDCSLIDFPA
jgi:adenylate kinase family enzyme